MQRLGPNSGEKRMQRDHKPENCPCGLLDFGQDRKKSEDTGQLGSAGTGPVNLAPRNLVASLSLSPPSFA